MNDRAYRRQQNDRVIKSRLKLVKERDDKHKDVTGKTYYEHVAEEPGRLRKKHPYDCGKTQCQLCHSEKLFGKAKISDKRRETMEELDEEIPE